MNKKKRIIIASGGSGGHIFPGLSVAFDLLNHGYDVLWLGVEGQMESELVPKHGINIRFIYAKKWNGVAFYKKFFHFLFIFFSIYQTFRIIKEWKPDLVLGMGGYVSASSGISAWICKIPLIIHEQNIIFGLTNRFLSLFAKRILQGLPSIYCNSEIVGNPIRNKILSVPDPKIRWKNRSGPIRVLVIGGSKGSHILNIIFPKIAAQLSRELIVWHQVGETELKDVILSYYQYNLYRYKIEKFIDDIAQAYAWADILISRSGALTVSEVIAIGLPAIFVPFPYHRDRQQYLNAMLLSKIGAAKIVDQKDFTSSNVIRILKSLNRNVLLDMANLAKTIDIPNTAKQIVKIIDYCVYKI